MKRTILALVLLVGLVAVPAIAQDFTSSRPQFFSFSYTIPIGFNLGIEDVVVGQAHNFSIAFSVMDQLDVGFDYITLRGDAGFVSHAHLIRIHYHLFDRLGFGFGFGVSETHGSVLNIGIAGNFFQARAPSGFAFAMGLRLDYVAHLDHPDNLGEGTIFLGLRMTVGI
jgi:hypothetical protein